MSEFISDKDIDIFTNGSWQSESIKNRWFNNESDFVYCSVCKNRINTKLCDWKNKPFNYCPYCGIKMEV